MENSSKKEWYKTWWGVILAILFLPIFIVWYVWAKTKLSQVWKIVITVVMGIMVITSFTNKQTPSTVSNSKPSQGAQTQTFQSVFDVPSLVGKNIDEIRQVLGEPADKTLTEPNAQQLALGTKEWDNTFKKDGKELLVTFNVQSRKVVDFFIGTDDPLGKTKDKKHLMELGGVKDSNPNYRIEFVKAIIDPSFYTGVKIIPAK